MTLLLRGLLLVGVWMFSQHALAEPITLKFISIQVAPWGWQDSESGEIRGAFAEMVKELDARVDADLSITLTPFARVDRELELGGHDCTILIPRPEEMVVRGEVVGEHDIGVIPARDVTLNDYSQLKGKKVAVLRGASITSRFDADVTFQKVYDTNYLMSLRKLDRQRVDAVAGAIPTMRYLAEKNGLAGALGKPLKLGDVPLTLQCSRQSRHLDLLPALNRAVMDMKAEGVIERIKSEYYF
ncbi:substrate-binding periplasmic protein [Gilvimarinus xylanilyticus]|uniref:ABC transporter substrate-binding protein n=1 Tax=Gilvimarinus xylanilyticus TaxID=2944139 RepID=A0A9X2I459_9GAMM|nr:ABC transporter substrate-binding protein [Gilvimarinus xylanilyticus]MCP8899646.1 ABC transporter substrate-binding protein [Gilvimarinus xylanilyticus]